MNEFATGDLRGRLAGKRIQGIAVGIVSTVTLGYYATRGVDLRAMMADVRTADFRWLAAIAVSTLLADLIRSVRWGCLLNPVRDVPLGVRLPAVLVGSAGNHLLPLRLGEFLRIHRLAVRGKVSYATTLATLVIERVFDVIGIMLILGCCLLSFPAAREMDARLEAIIRVLFAFCALFVVSSAVVLCFRQRTAAWVDRQLQRHSTGRLRRLAIIANDLIAGLRSLGNGRQVAAIMGYTILMWTVFGLCFAFGLVSLDLAGAGAGALVARASVVLVFVSIFTMVPAAFGLVGTFQAACVVGLAIFGVSKGQALGFSVVVHAVQFVTCSLAGAPFIVSSLRNR